MFLLPLALMAMAGSPASKTPDNRHLTPPPLRIKVKVIKILLTPRDKVALGDKDNEPYSFKNHYHALYAYVARQHLVIKGIKVGEGLVENNQPAVLEPYKFSHPIVAGRHIYLTLRFLNIPINPSGMTPPIHWQADIDAVSEDVAMVEMIHRGNRINGLVYAQLTLLPSGNE